MPASGDVVVDMQPGGPGNAPKPRSGRDALRGCPGAGGANCDRVVRRHAAPETPAPSGRGGPLVAASPEETAAVLAPPAPPVAPVEDPGVDPACGSDLQAISGAYRWATGLAPRCAEARAAGTAGRAGSACGASLPARNGPSRAGDGGRVARPRATQPGRDPYRSALVLAAEGPAIEAAAQERALRRRLAGGARRGAPGRLAGRQRPPHLPGPRGSQRPVAKQSNRRVPG